MDIDEDGTAAVVLTYKNAYHFERAPGETWGLAFEAMPEVLRVPPLKIGEALTFGRHGRTLYVSSEERPSPLFRFDRTD